MSGLRIEEFIKEKLGIEVNVKIWKRSERVLIVKLENEKIKKEIMINKSKLKGENIFIENDLSWDDRKA